MVVDKDVCKRWCVTKLCVKDMVCDKVVCERYGVGKMVCDKVVCKRWCMTKLCKRRYVTKLRVKDGV